jgi:hypothetical protein
LNACAIVTGGGAGGGVGGGAAGGGVATGGGALAAGEPPPPPLLLHAASTDIELAIRSSAAFLLWTALCTSVLEARFRPKRRTHYPPNRLTRRADPRPGPIRMLASRGSASGAARARMPGRG